jgi:hypothetical protein
MDFKYPLKKHPNYNRTADFGQKPYQKKFEHYEKYDLEYTPELKNIEIIEFTEGKENEK